MTTGNSWLVILTSQTTLLGILTRGGDHGPCHREEHRIGACPIAQGTASRGRARTAPGSSAHAEHLLLARDPSLRVTCPSASGTAPEGTWDAAYWGCNGGAYGWHA